MALETLDEHALGLTWVLDDPLRRASHALADAGRVWLVDPVDEPEALERAAALGTPQAVLQLLDRHNRDNAAIAARLGVPLLRLPEDVPGAPFAPFGVLRVPGWKEVALWWPARRGLVVAEGVGTNEIYAIGDGPVGVHPMLRLFPPRVLGGYDPEHLLVGHGEPVHGPEASTALKAALARSRRDVPRLLTRLPALARAARS